jgi:hypothetical protein
MPSRKWVIQDQRPPADPESVETIQMFTIEDGSDDGPLLTDENIWEIVDVLIAKGFVTQNGVSVRATVPSSDHAVDRPEEV